MFMRTTNRVMAALAAIALLVTCATVRASEDSRIEASAKKSYVYRTYLKNDSIKIDAKDGIVTLTGTVSEESHKGLAADTVKGLPGVKSVDNRLEVNPPNPTAKSDDWI